jgi:hypothetical protein
MRAMNIVTRPALAVAILASAFVLVGCIAGAPTPVPVVPGQPFVDCQGVPAATCQTIVDDVRRNADPGSVPVRIKAVCTSPPCTPQGGNVQVEVLYSNGRPDSYGMGWGAAPAEPAQTPPPEPSLPVLPACLGVPAGPCRNAAVNMVANAGGRLIRTIVVRCTTAVCTDAKGEGATTVTFGDGTTETSNWSYENGTP